VTGALHSIRIPLFGASATTVDLLDVAAASIVRHVQRHQQRKGHPLCSFNHSLVLQVLVVTQQADPASLVVSPSLLLQVLGEISNEGGPQLRFVRHSDSHGADHDAGGRLTRRGLDLAGRAAGSRNPGRQPGLFAVNPGCDWWT
jgi:hypothetical protein